MIVLKGITWEDPRGYMPLEMASKIYKEKFDVEIHWEKRSLKKFIHQSLLTLANNYDILVIDHPHIGVAPELMCLVPLDTIISADELGTLRNFGAGPSFSSYYYANHQWALPLDIGVQCSVYRPDLLEPNLPTTWEEVFQLAETLKNKNKRIGIAFNPSNCICVFLSLAASLGSPVKEENKEFVDQSVGRKVLKQMRIMRDVFHKNSMHWDTVQLLDYMSKHDDIVYSPMMFGYSNYSRKGYREHELAFSTIPGVKNSVFGGAGIAVSYKCHYPMEVVSFIKWLFSSEVQKGIYFENQGQPANIEAWRDFNTNEGTRNFFKNTLDSLERAYVRPYYSGWPLLQEYLGEIIHAHLEKDSDPDLTIKVMQDAYSKSKNLFS